ncbi:hypothetical protein SAMN05444321_0171 [Bradyrhizobium lablabi]|nr:hypothetical protein SAMN05444321_0171 [Bradyrhizobium lablabi]
MKTKLLLATVFAASAAAFVTETPANAAGCGGYVNIMQWGCAPWDNNPPKKGVTPGYPAIAPKITLQPPASVISNDGGSLAKAGAPVISNDGGSVISNDGGSAVAKNTAGLVGNAGGTFVGNNGSAVLQKSGNGLVSDNGLGLVATGGGNAISDNGAGIISRDGAGLLGQDGSSLVRNGAALLGQDGSSLVRNGSGLLGQDGSSLISQDGAGLNLKGPTAYKAAAPTENQLQAQKAAADTRKAANDLIAASDLVKRDGVALQNAKTANDLNLVGQLQTKIDADNKAVVTAGAIMLATSTLVPPTEADTVKKVANLLNDSINAAKTNVDTGNASANAAPAKPQPSQLQIDTTNAAAATAATAAKAAVDANSQVLALTATLGNRPTNPDDLKNVNRTMAESAVVTAKANLAKAQSDLVAMSAKGASAYDIQGQKDLIAKAQTNVTYQTAMVANDYAGKAVNADTARADLATAKAVVDGLTKAYGSNRPADPQQLTTINTAMVVQALAQDKADMALADATAVRLAANGASKSDVQTQTDLVATKQKDMANILKVNPQIVAAAGVAANTDPAIVAKALAGLVAVAATQTSTTVQLTNAQVQSALAAVQQLKTAANATRPAGTTSASAAEASAMLNTLTKAAATYSLKSLDTPVAATAASSGSVVTQPASATQAATAKIVATTQTAPVVDKSELTPAVVQMLVQSGPATIQAMQSAQQAALAKGDKALADGLGKDIVNLQAQVAAAKAMPPVETAKTVAATTAATTAPAVGAAVAVKPASSPAVMANASPAVTAPAGASATTTTKPGESSAPAKISDDQSKAVHQALRTIPGDLTKAEQKSFAALSAMVDRATAKGLTAEEATYLKEGIEALAEKHPKAEKQNGLTRIANTVATQKPAVATAAPVGTAAAPPVTAAAPAASAMPSVAQPAQSRAPEQVMSKPEAPKSASATPAITVQPTTPKTEMRNEPKAAVASTTPAAISPPTPAKPSPTHEVHVEPHPAVASRAVPAATPAPVARVEPAKMATPAVRAAPPAVAAPRPPAVAAAKPPAPPAAKPQSCSPNMVNGKMMGMTCH